MPNETWTEGWLPDGTHFHIDHDPCISMGQLRINGEPVELAGPALVAVSRLRDGGTTIIETTQGRFVAHRRMRAEHFDSWNGERLLTKPELPAPETFGHEGGWERPQPQAGPGEQR